MTIIICLNRGSAISNGRERRSCLGRLFNIALGSFVSKQPNCMAHTHTATSRVENSAQVSSSWLKFVCPWFKVQAADRFCRECKRRLPDYSRNVRRQTVSRRSDPSKDSGERALSFRPSGEDPRWPGAIVIKLFKVVNYEFL